MPPRSSHVAKSLRLPLYRSQTAWCDKPPDPPNDTLR
eukprot:CAMPEP_0119540270 /NCGR_PEP_ID=MMETSP1344-20130328/52205_1 /TAXON_ID=236787 /ORGANISM="Florenciella parvula, Strain CCMP2471" /LENGTH=36 /DNA_ID= /DNA_START= /DNA_END= /DNA_ORIENTATION=